VIAMTIKPGDALPPLSSGPISRHTIAAYAAGSGDLNPVHVDIDFAKDKAGLPDVIVHGMFVMGYLGRVAAAWHGPMSVREIDVRFEAMVSVHDNLRCSGKVVSVEAAGQGWLVKLDLTATKTDGTRAASGSAIVLVPPAA
jgi:acyl dehydratase